ncbi:hypothetical protein OF83DRAFT_688173 [Amylostereum chailletii]|nr:hypothetical protein OF83DRAFT_688173 [Amylostereum chailletii]
MCLNLGDAFMQTSPSQFLYGTEELKLEGVFEFPLHFGILTYTSSELRDHLSGAALSIKNIIWARSSQARDRREVYASPALRDIFAPPERSTLAVLGRFRRRMGGVALTVVGGPRDRRDERVSMNRLIVRLNSPLLNGRRLTLERRGPRSGLVGYGHRHIVTRWSVSEGMFDSHRLEQQDPTRSFRPRLAVSDPDSESRST